MYIVAAVVLRECCPVGAIDTMTVRAEGSKCIRCCACVKRCPRHSDADVRACSPAPRLLAVKGKRLEERTYL
ncbi:MAG TPA: hypothetical protein VK436_14225 [Methanocella sp.]|nr:hypothetical protein [Methanocella sp.]